MKYRLSYRETTLKTIDIEADSPTEAIRQMFDGEGEVVTSSHGSWCDEIVDQATGISCPRNHAGKYE